MVFFKSCFIYLIIIFLVVLLAFYCLIEIILNNFVKVRKACETNERDRLIF